MESQRRARFGESFRDDEARITIAGTCSADRAQAAAVAAGDGQPAETRTAGEGGAAADRRSPPLAAAAAAADRRSPRAGAAAALAFPAAAGDLRGHPETVGPEHKSGSLRAENTSTEAAVRHQLLPVRGSSGSRGVHTLVQ